MKTIDRIVGITLLITMFLLFSACKYTEANKGNYKYSTGLEVEHTDVIVGAQRIALYYPYLEGKRVATVVNQTSRVGEAHLVDTLLTMKVNVAKIFAPEHGFRGDADAGEHINNGIDAKTGLPIISLYGKNRKPSQEQLEGIDIVVFDIQDVGARFYTYISTLHYVMEACAELGIPVIVLDRPNPNGHYVDGPIREEEFKSFVGMHPVPVVYGMTIGEYATMINGEKWLKDGIRAELTVIECKKYNHETFYELPVKPSPNLPNIRSILLYPSLCFFEGTTVSVGRGTDKQFQIYGHPEDHVGSYKFTPSPMAGAKYPKHDGKQCFGASLETATLGSIFDKKQLNLEYLLGMYKRLNTKEVKFFNDNNFFEKLAGTSNLRKQIKAGMNEVEIRNTWKEGLEKFKKIRAKYLLYD